MRAVTGAETPTARPAAIRTAALIVESTTAVGRAPRDLRENAAASSAGANPRRVSRPRSRAPPHEPHLDGADRKLKLTGGLLVRHSLEVAEDDRRPVLFGQTGDLFLNFRDQARRVPILGVFFRHRRPPSFVSGPLRPPCPRPPRDPAGDAEEPARDRRVFADRAGLPRQDQKRGLERILGVVRVVKHAKADAEHHRAVPVDQGREGDLGGVSGPADEPLDQLAVRQRRGRPDGEERLDASQDRPGFLALHEAHPRPKRKSTLCRAARRAKAVHLFLQERCYRVFSPPRKGRTSKPRVAKRTQGGVSHAHRTVPRRGSTRLAGVAIDDRYVWD